VGILLAACSAVVYGAGDFLGGVAARRVPALVVAAWAQIVGLLVLAVVAPVWPHPHLGAAAWGWGAVGGCFGAIGISMFYAALSRGPMAVAAPLAALVGTLIPVIVGIVDGDRPSVVGWVGVVVALPAIVLVARGPSAGASRLAPATLAMSVVAGVGFGGFFVAFSRIPDGAGMVPLLSARFASVGLLGLALLVRHRRPTVGLGDRWSVLGAGVSDVTANGLYLLAITRGLLSVIAVVSAMYPASTVVLARLVLRERLSPGQRVGLGCAAVSVALVALGS
jgi:drug/metabolite transporter (DMT)-like permease